MNSIGIIATKQVVYLLKSFLYVPTSMVTISSVRENILVKSKDYSKPNQPKVQIMLGLTITAISYDCKQVVCPAIDRSGPSLGF